MKVLTNPVGNLLLHHVAEWKSIKDEPATDNFQDVPVIK
jgi:hypothetical protein